MELPQTLFVLIFIVCRIFMTDSILFYFRLLKPQRAGPVRRYSTGHTNRHTKNLRLFYFPAFITVEIFKVARSCSDTASLRREVCFFSSAFLRAVGGLLIFIGLSSIAATADKLGERH